MSEPLTQPQKNALEALAALSDANPAYPDRAVAPKAVALALWPDSEAWTKRNRGRRTGTIAGAVGGTMPMKAANLLWRLRERGLAEPEEHGSDLWILTPLGRRVLAGTDVPKPKPVKVPEPKIERQRKPPHRQPGAGFRG